MAKGQYLSSYQQGIVKRYYEHRDTVALQRLGELVSELYLCDSAPKAERLWKHAETALAKCGATKADIARVLGAKRPEALAELLKKMS